MAVCGQASGRARVALGQDRWPSPLHSSIRGALPLGPVELGPPSSPDLGCRPGPLWGRSSRGLTEGESAQTGWAVALATEELCLPLFPLREGPETSSSALSLSFSVVPGTSGCPARGLATASHDAFHSTQLPPRLPLPALRTSKRATPSRKSFWNYPLVNLDKQ